MRSDAGASRQATRGRQTGEYRPFAATHSQVRFASAIGPSATSGDVRFSAAVGGCPGQIWLDPGRTGTPARFSTGGRFPFEGWPRRSPTRTQTARRRIRRGAPQNPPRPLRFSAPSAVTPDLTVSAEACSRLLSHVGQSWDSGLFRKHAAAQNLRDICPAVPPNLQNSSLRAPRARAESEQIESNELWNGRAGADLRSAPAQSDWIFCANTRTDRRPGSCRRAPGWWRASPPARRSTPRPGGCT
jgi:hypothetical protein